MSSVHLVGRAAELATAQSAVERARASASASPASVLLIAGEAGIGKTRLLGEVLARAGRDGVRTTYGRCLAHGSLIRPVNPVSELLAGLGESSDATTPDDNPTRAAARLFDHARTVLRTVAADDPVIVAIDDLQWSDRTTRSLLLELLRTDGLGRLLVVGTYRSDELHRRHPLLTFLADLEHACRPEHVELAPLTEAEVSELAREILDGPLADGAVHRLLRRSGGNPLFAEELLRVDDAQPIPAGLGHVILARTRDLPEDSRRCLQSAAVLSPPIDVATLHRTTGLTDTRFTSAVDTLVRERLVLDEPGGLRFRHDLVREVFADELLPGERVELFRRAADALTAHRPERRGEIARLRAEAAQLPEALRSAVEAGAAAAHIGASAEASEQYALAIDIWDRVEDPTTWSGITHVRLLRDAAQAADLARDFDVAVALCQRAADEAMATNDRHAAGAALFELSGYLWNASAPGLDETLQRALTVLPRDPPTTERLRLELRVGMHRAFAGDPAADELLAETARRAADAGDDAVETAASTYVGWGRALLGGTTEIARLTHGVERAPSIDDGPTGITAFVNLSHTLASLGRFDEVADLYDDGVAFAERHGLTDTHGIVFQGNVLLALEPLGRWADADAVMTTIRRRLSPETTHRWASAFLGWTQIQIQRGRHDEVVASYRRGLSMWETGYYDGDQLPVGTGLIELAAAGAIEPISLATVESWLAGVQPGQATLAARLVAVAARHLIPPSGADGHERARDQVGEWVAALRAVAATYLEVPAVLDTWLDQVEAERVDATGDADPERWAAVSSSWATLRCPYFAAVAMARQADAILRAGGGRSARDRTTAAALLGDAHRTAEALGAEPLREDVVDLARRARLRIGGTEPQPPVAPASDRSSRFGLTGREIDVLRLVNEGRSNGEIGAELFISTKTASVHVSNILRKLGASNRIEAAAIARRHDLVVR